MSETEYGLGSRLLHRIALGKTFVAEASYDLEQALGKYPWEPIEMKTGAIIDYTLRLYGIPVRWRTRIDLFEPEIRFIDTQVKGPYRYWRHLHEFDEIDAGTSIRDKVDYELPFGPLGTMARALFVRGSLESIFQYRRQAVADIFGSP